MRFIGKMIIHKSLQYPNEFAKVNFYQPVKNSGIIITPDIELIARELTGQSQLGLLISRLKKIDLTKLAVLFKNNLPNIYKIASKNFAMGISLLCELEILHSQRNQFILHCQVVDSAIALKNKDILTNFFILSRKYHFTPGLMSFNPGPLINFLSITPNVPKNIKIYLPINKNNYLMSPLYADIIEFLDKSPFEFIPVRI